MFNREAGYRCFETKVTPQITLVGKNHAGRLDVGYFGHSG